MTLVPILITNIILSCSPEGAWASNEGFKEAINLCGKRPWSVERGDQVHCTLPSGAVGYMKVVGVTCYKMIESLNSPSSNQ